MKGIFTKHWPAYHENVDFTFPLNLFETQSSIISNFFEIIKFLVCSESTFSGYGVNNKIAMFRAQTLIKDVRWDVIEITDTARNVPCISEMKGVIIINYFRKTRKYFICT